MALTRSISRTHYTACSTWTLWFFLGLVVIARAKHPVPSRTRPLSAVAPMVLRLKTWESRSPPNLVRTIKHVSLDDEKNIQKIKAINTLHQAGGWDVDKAIAAYSVSRAALLP